MRPCLGAGSHRLEDGRRRTDPIASPKNVTENSALWIPRCQRHFRHSGRVRQRSSGRGLDQLMPRRCCTLRYPVQMSVATRPETEDPHMLSPQWATRLISRNSGGGRFQSAKVRTGILRPGDNRRRRLRRPAIVVVSCDEMWTYRGARHGAKREDWWIWTAVVGEADGSSRCIWGGLRPTGTW